MRSREIDLSLSPTPERFRALARSSPWRWSSVEFEWDLQGEGRHAWIRRPGGLRVESAAGELLHAEPDEPPRTSTTFSADGSAGPSTLVRGGELQPDYDAEGLVAERPDAFLADYDAPFFESYHWIAMLDPVEFADSDIADDPDLPDLLGAAPVELTGLRLVDHHGRPAWEATAMPTPAYTPRCGCCPLLDGGLADAVPWRPTTPALVRLDLGTGICVRVQPLDAGGAVELEVRILAVDQDYDDALFAKPPRRLGRLIRRMAHGTDR